MASKPQNTESERQGCALSHSKWQKAKQIAGTSFFTVCLKKGVIEVPVHLVESRKAKQWEHRHARTGKTLVRARNAKKAAARFIYLNRRFGNNP